MGSLAESMATPLTLATDATIGALDPWAGSTVYTAGNQVSRAYATGISWKIANAITVPLAYQCILTTDGIADAVTQPEVGTAWWTYWRALNHFRFSDPASGAFPAVTASTRPFFSYKGRSGAVNFPAQILARVLSTLTVTSGDVGALGSIVVKIHALKHTGTFGRLDTVEVTQDMTTRLHYVDIVSSWMLLLGTDLTGTTQFYVECYATNAASNGKIVCVEIYDDSVNVHAVGGDVPATNATVAAAVLIDPANKISTDAAGRVRAKGGR